MNNRPYFSLKISELQEIYHENYEDLNIQNNLLIELNNRKTPKAKKLRKEVIARIEILKSDTPQLKKSQIASPRKTQPETKTEEVVPNIVESLFVEKPSVENIIKHDFKYEPDKRPPIKNEPTNILEAWFSIEVLSPQTFKKPEDLADGEQWRILSLNDKSLPWEGKVKSKPKSRLYFEIVLGTVLMAPITEQLIHIFGDNRPERPNIKDKSIIATILVDKEGRPIEENPITISSFGWAVGQIRKGDLNKLSKWPEAEKKLKEDVSHVVNIRDTEGKILPLSIKAIRKAFDIIVNSCGFYGDEVEPPQFAIKQFQWIGLSQDPDPLLLNSFYLDDLNRALYTLNENSEGAALSRYLGKLVPTVQYDLLQNDNLLRNILSPINTSLSRWPLKGGHPLSLLQQAAINQAAKLNSDGDILAINGPPGTGKTTLLKDLVAEILLSRTMELIKFDDPETAFSHVGKMKVGTGWVHLYSLADTVRGNEIVVASSNNKAVENVSREFPQEDQVDSSISLPQYFKTTSDALSENSESTWGLISGVLGNSKNRSKFRKIFWQDEDMGLKQYLHYAVGKEVYIQEKDPDTGEVTPRIPSVVQMDSIPFGKKEALANWNNVKKKFMSLYNEVESKRTTLHNVFIALDEYKEKYREYKSLKTTLANIKSKFQEETKKQKVIEQKQKLLIKKEEELHEKNLKSENTKPGFVARLLKTKSWKVWLNNSVVLSEKYNITKNKREIVDLEKQQHQDCLDEIKKSYRRSYRLLIQLKEEITSLKKLIQSAKISLGRNFPDDKFWKQSHADLQKSSPWMNKEYLDKRAELFATSLEVHKSFIDAAAKPIRHNIAALMQIFLGKLLKEQYKDLHVHLWSTLFLITPVISTTFASIGRMFKHIPKESFGWLLIDEAGQALPQAAVGAIERSRKVVVVGDPLQIEPVVTLSNKLSEAICFEHGIDPELWNAPEVSVQVLADTTTVYRAELEKGDGSIIIGSPLLVHRRCEEPMFSISNQIAYNNLMVKEVTQKPSMIRDILGPSKWIDIKGESNRHWNQQEGEEVLHLLTSLQKNGIVDPDIYIITPFRECAQRMKTYLRAKSHQFLDHLSTDNWVWLNERIGTIHTFQGKEAESVILMLGASNENQGGARSWAGGSPNLINVAVSRAKNSFYVVGDRERWKNHGYFVQLSALIS